MSPSLSSQYAAQALGTGCVACARPREGRSYFNHLPRVSLPCIPAPHSRADNPTCDRKPSTARSHLTPSGVQQSTEHWESRPVGEISAQSCRERMMPRVTTFSRRHGPKERRLSYPFREDCQSLAIGPHPSPPSPLLAHPPAYPPTLPHPSPPHPSSPKPHSHSRPNQHQHKQPHIPQPLHLLPARHLEHRGDP